MMTIDSLAYLVGAENDKKTPIRDRRIELELTQADIARYVGVSVNSYRSWEQGLSTPSFDNAVRLADILEVG